MYTCEDGAVKVSSPEMTAILSHAPGSTIEFSWLWRPHPRHLRVLPRRGIEDHRIPGLPEVLRRVRGVGTVGGSRRNGKCVRGFLTRQVEIGRQAVGRTGHRRGTERLEPGAVRHRHRPREDPAARVRRQVRHGRHLEIGEPVERHGGLFVVHEHLDTPTRAGHRADPVGHAFEEGVTSPTSSPTLMIRVAFDVLGSASVIIKGPT